MNIYDIFLSSVTVLILMVQLMSFFLQTNLLIFDHFEHSLIFTKYRIHLSPVQSCKSGAKLCKVGIYCFSIFGAGGDCNEASWEQDWKIVGNIFQLAIISAENYLIAGLNIFRFLFTRPTIKQWEAE